MNVAVINLKDIWKYAIKVISIFFVFFLLIKAIPNPDYSIKQRRINKVNSEFLISCLELSIPTLKTETNNKKNEIKLTNLLGAEISLLNKLEIKNTNDLPEARIAEENKNVPKETVSPDIEIPKIANTEVVTDRNFSSKVTNIYGTTKIDNQSNYTITEDMLIPDVEILNKKDILIYHTHTCESYTPCDIYNYTMTGNYRTTDDNYNVIRVGTELSTYLTQKGFNVIHDGTYYDYPSYSGSYARALETATRLLEEKPAGLVIDIHRDAIGNGDTYGPTVMVNGQRVAQLMFVIGTDGGGLEHPNWVQNLKTAVKIQEQANKMYPGLFRSIIIRNSRYNQHISSGASIIEVGATANTLGECLLSMQCLANVIDEVCK